jgi:hypothetical protein
VTTSKNHSGFGVNLFFHVIYITQLFTNPKTPPATQLQLPLGEAGVTGIINYGHNSFIPRAKFILPVIRFSREGVLGQSQNSPLGKLNDEREQSMESSPRRVGGKLALCQRRLPKLWQRANECQRTVYGLHFTKSLNSLCDRVKTDHKFMKTENRTCGKLISLINHDFTLAKLRMHRRRHRHCDQRMPLLLLLPDMLRRTHVRRKKRKREENAEISAEVGGERDHSTYSSHVSKICGVTQNIATAAEVEEKVGHDRRRSCTTADCAH